jgi:hypothetical protein
VFEKSRTSQAMTTKKREKLFEFYRVLDNSITDTKGEGHVVELCKLPHRRAITTRLSAICAQAYGAGSFVALEIAENFEGLPLSYWVIKIKSIERHSQKEVSLDDQQLRNYRQFYHLASTEDGEALTLDGGRPFWAAVMPKIANMNPDSWQRGAEAALASQHLKSLSDPEPKKRKVARRIGRKTDPINDWMREQRARGANKKDIVPDAMTKFGLTQDQAESKYKNSQRSEQISRQRQRARKAEGSAAKLNKRKANNKF